MSAATTTPIQARRRIAPRSFAVVFAVATAGWAVNADAKPDVKREGVQVEGLIGGSNCLPGRAACKADNATLRGATRGAIGGGVSVGWRARRWMYVGAMYRGGMFRPDYEIIGGPAYDRAAQHSFLGVVRPIIPLWRFDLGLNLAPGYSRQTFTLDDRNKDYTQGFAFGVGPVVDLYVTKRLFLGFEADFIFNAHKNVCEVRGASTACIQHAERHPNPVHQAIYGLHLGITTGR